MKLEFLNTFSKNTRTPYFMKIRPVGAKLFNPYRRTDRTDKASSCYSQFCQHTY